MHQLLIALSLLLLMPASMGTSSVENNNEVANNIFGLNLYKKLTETQKDNIIFSPVSISFALALTSLGAKGNTLEEIRKALIVGGVPDDVVHGKYKAFMNDILRDEDNIRVNIANRLFVNISFPILPEFLNKSDDFYGARAESVDFRRKERTASIVNNWVSEKTHQKITSILTANDIDPLTVLVLINAIYFKSSWEVDFDKNETKKQDFHVGPDVIVQTDFMHNPKCKGLYGFNENLHFEVFEKYFHKKEFSFGIILPDLTKTSLENIEKNLTPDVLDVIPMDEHLVNVSFPKFKFEKEADLNDILKKLGLNDMFGTSADLSGINGKGDLVVSKVLHKAIIEVAEEGVTAAAVTSIEVIHSSVQEITNFRADHPFLFYIRHKNSGSFLFFGRFSKP